VDVNGVLPLFLDIRHGLFAFFIENVSDNRGAPFLSEAEGDSPAHAPGAAGDKGNPVFE
jgi:hypothetical protein